MMRTRTRPTSTRCEHTCFARSGGHLVLRALDWVNRVVAGAWPAATRFMVTAAAGLDCLDGLPGDVRGVLYCAVDLFGNSGDAGGEAGRCALRAAHCGLALRDLRPAGPADRLRAAAAIARDVSQFCRRGFCVSCAAGSAHRASSVTRTPERRGLRPAAPEADLTVPAVSGRAVLTRVRTRRVRGATPRSARQPSVAVLRWRVAAHAGRGR